MLLHGIFPGPRGDGYEKVIYAWILDTTAGQVPVSVQVDAAWISMAPDRTEVNKIDTVDAAVSDASPYARPIPLSA